MQIPGSAPALEARYEMVLWPIYIGSYMSVAYYVTSYSIVTKFAKFAVIGISIFLIAYYLRDWLGRSSPK